MSNGDVCSARSEISSADPREIHERRRCQSQLSANENLRFAAQHTNRPALSAYCAHCKHPLLIDVTTHETSANSRVLSTRDNQRVCKECSKDKVEKIRTPSSRLFKSASLDWTHVGDRIETWFETARTPDQRVVYNFLEKINHDPEKDVNRTIDPPQEKTLDDILKNLKKYRARFNSSRSTKKFRNAFESTSWRVMRHPSTTPRQYSRYNAVYGDDASRDFRIGTVFTTTEPRIGSTFLLHPGWV